MNNRRYRIFLAILAAALLSSLASCSKSGRIDATVGTPVRVERFDSLVALYGQASAQQRDSLLAEFRPAIDLMCRINGIADADSLIEAMALSRVFNVFFPDVVDRLPALNGLQTELGSLRELLPRQIDSLRFPSRVFGIVTPYDQTVMISDTVMLIGLNHYLGADYPGYNGFDDYRRRQKTLLRAPIDIAEALVYTSSPFPASAESTALQRMVYEGAVVAAVSRSLPGRPINEILGYTPDEMAWLDSHESEIWRKLISDGLLYSHDRAVAERLVMPAPFTSVISTEAPGRTGRFIGYKIAESYLAANPSSTPADILSPSLLLSDDLLLRAGYRR